MPNNSSTILPELDEMPPALRVPRRTALRSAVVAAGAGVLPRWFVEENAARGAADEPESPNDRPRILLGGCGGMGKADAKNAQSFGDIVAVCDVDSDRLGKAAEELKAEAKYGDFRKAMAHKGIDVVLNGTPDHWHTLVNI